MKATLSKLAPSIIAKRLVWKVTFFASLASIILTVFFGFITWSNETKEIKKRFNEIEKSYLDVIRETLWVNDVENLNVILMGITRLPGIEYVDIHSKEKIICMAGEKASQATLTHTFPIVHTFNENTYNLGELHIIGSLDYVHQKILKTMLTIVLSQVSIILVICVLLTLLFYRTVIGRLLKITSYAYSLSIDSLGTPLVLDKERITPDELNDLANVINRMQENLHQAFSRQKEVEGKLKQHRRDLEKIVEQRTSSLNETNKELQIEINDRKKIEEEREKVIADLKKALAEIKTLRGILPVCSNCKKIRDDQGYWEEIEVYISERSDADFSHGVCPECVEELYGEDLRDLRKNKQK
jgi:methyl-accepting chemotaxis protein